MTADTAGCVDPLIVAQCDARRVFNAAFDEFRRASIIHGIKARSVRGTASPQVAEMARSLDPLARFTWHQTELA